MIDISKYLSNIKNAIYGVEVRDSIHDAIKECGDLVNQSYKDATGHPDSVSAVVRDMILGRSRLNELENISKDMSNDIDDLEKSTDELAQDILVERSRIDELLGANTLSGEYTTTKLNYSGFYEFANDQYPIRPYVYSNGINAVLAIAIPEDRVEGAFCNGLRKLCDLPPELAPLDKVSHLIGCDYGDNLYLSIGKDGTVEIEGDGSYNSAVVVVGPYPPDARPDADPFRCLYVPYALKNPSMTELNDIRVGADGKVYPTAGEAIRTQMQKLDSKGSSARTMVEVLRKLVDKAVFTDDVTELIDELDRTLYEGMFRVSYALNNIISSNTSPAVEEGDRFATALTAKIGYKIASVTVTMGGEDITESSYSDGVITIESVTGDVVITAISMDAGLVMLKSITGDGASYIDTEFIPDSLDYRYEFAIKADDYDNNVHNPTSVNTMYTIFGVDMYNVGSAYHRIYAFLQNKTKVTFDCLGQPSAGGSWNLPTFFADNIGYCVCKNGFAQVYTDAEHSTLPNWNEATSGVAADESKCPIKPMYLFTVNATENSFVTEQGKKYPITKFTLYEFKIYRDSTNELLHNFVPAAKGSKIGVCDTITGKFHENKGTGTFAYEEVSA